MQRQVSRVERVQQPRPCARQRRGRRCALPLATSFSHNCTLQAVSCERQCAARSIMYGAAGHRLSAPHISCLHHPYTELLRQRRFVRTRCALPPHSTALVPYPFLFMFIQSTQPPDHRKRTPLRCTALHHIKQNHRRTAASYLRSRACTQGTQECPPPPARCLSARTSAATPKRGLCRAGGSRRAPRAPRWAMLPYARKPMQATS